MSNRISQTNSASTATNRFHHLRTALKRATTITKEKIPIDLQGRMGSKPLVEE